MVSFRKLFPVLAVIGLLVATGTASAQVQNCTASALTPLVRVEGLTEPIGRITVTCEIGAGTTAAPALYFKLISSNVNFTNTIIDSTAQSVTAKVTPTVAGTGFATVGTTANGKLVSATEIDFNNVALPFQTGATVVQVVIDNVRVNASQAAKNTTISMTINGTAVTPGSTQTLQILNVTRDVASVQQGLNFSVTAGNALSQCNTATAAPALSDATAVLKFTPGYAYAFRGPTGTNTEPPDAPATTKGLQLEARFSGVPSGSDLYVTRLSTNTGTGTSVATYNSTSATGDFVKLTIGSDNTATAVWNITSISSSDPTTPLTFGVVLRQHASGTQIGLGNLQVSGNLGPRSSQGTATSTTDVPVPRFVDATPSNSNLIGVNPCQTTLLFPYVISQGGFDTGIALSNTAKDIQLANGNYLFGGGTTALNGQPGTCTLNYFGTTSTSGGSTAAQTTASIATGAVEVFLLGQGAGAADAGVVGRPGFVGYMIANCNFVNAHGFAFITSGPGGMTMGYNALVLGTRTASGALVPGTTSTSAPETLGQ